MQNPQTAQAQRNETRRGSGRYRDHSLTVTAAVLVLMAFFLVVAYSWITVVLQNRSISRMEEGVNTVIKEVTAKLDRDSNLLNAAAQIISRADNFDIEATLDVMESVAPLLETMHINVLTADNKILSVGGTVTDATTESDLDFARESALGEHVSNRMTSLNGEPILRHFVPIMQQNSIAAMLYGVTMLEEMPDVMNIENIYNASADVFIVDTKTGDFILDTSHSGLGNLLEMKEEDETRVTKGALTWEKFTEDIMNLGTGYVIFRSGHTDGWQYVYYAPAGINQWAIAVSVPETETFANVRAVQQVWLILGVLLSVVVALYYLWVRQNAQKATAQAVEQAVLREKLQKAEAADKAKSTFLSNMSHDIRTPMNAIIGFATLAQNNLSYTERVQEYLRKILTAGNHLLSLINDILDMSRIESGKLHIEEKPCSLSEIFRDMRDIINTQMQSKQLNFFMDTVDVTDEDIFCDKLHINQVLLNLLSNAIKFTPEGGTVSVTMRQLPDAPKGYGAYEIRVKDTGIGMSQDFVQHIFEPFERERTSTISGIQGTGLGMAITKNIVDAMNGEIRVETEQGRGSEFIIHLNFRLQADHQPDGPVPGLEGVRALVADDSVSACDSATKMLRRMGMRAEWTMHGKEAVLRAGQAQEMGDPYGVYLIDWLMPDLGGLEAVRQIRAAVGEQAIIVVVTAYDWTAFEREAREAGVTAFCNKPVFLSELRNILSAAMQHAPQAEKGAPGKVKKSFDGIRLLVVEDNELNRDIAVELLTEIGFLVETAGNGSVAVDMVKRSAPGYYALILMDIQMPVMNGYEAAKAIRALKEPELRRIPIVAMTADAFEEDRSRALKSGMNAHVAKPIDINKMIDAISEFIR